jgi:prolyl-tRNA editing enzyme YbaK/EbsC (Cys-tRNA(Pro) deacylase)
MPDKLNFQPVLKKPDLLPSSVIQFFQSGIGSNIANHVEVAEIDPTYTGSAEFTEHYGVLPEGGANTAIVEAVRGETRTIAACLVPIGTRADLNSLVRKTFNARRVSFAPLEEVLKKQAWNTEASL